MTEPRIPERLTRRDFVAGFGGTVAAVAFGMPADGLAQCRCIGQAVSALPFRA